MTLPSTALLILAMVLVVAIMAVVQKPRRSIATLNHRIALVQWDIAAAKRQHRSTKALQAELESLVAEKLRAERDLFKAPSRWRGARNG